VRYTNHGRVRRGTLRALVLISIALAAFVGSTAPAFAVGGIGGIIIDKTGPLMGATVSAWAKLPDGQIGATPTAETTTDAGGAYALMGLEPGAYVVSARKAPDYPLDQFFKIRRGAQSLNWPTAQVVVVPDLTTVPSTNITLVDAAPIEGRVTARADGSNLASITVALFNYVVPDGWEELDFTVTRPDGTYTLQAPANIVPVDGFRVQFRDANGRYATSIHSGADFFDQGVPFYTAANVATSGIDASLAVGAHITGRVAAADTGLPLARMTVSCLRRNPVTGAFEPANGVLRGLNFTAADGTYTWGGLNPGDYVIHFADEASFIYAAEYYRGARLITNATTIPVSEGTTVTSVDATLQVVDTKIPVTSSNVSAGWVRSPFMVSLTATDVGSGVAWTRYRVGEASSTTTYTVPFAVSGEGTVTVRYQSADVFGNIENTKTASVRLDATPPTTTASAAAISTNVATVDLSAVDNASGVATTYVGVDGAPLAPGTRVSVYGEGVHQVRFRSVDRAGNGETTRSVTVAVVRGPVAVSSVLGGDPLDTVLEASRVGFDANRRPSAVVIGAAAGWPDALGASALAGAANAPVLLTDPAHAPAVLAECARLRGLGASKVYLIGGPGLVPPALQSSLATAFGAGNVVRLYGPDRYATARLVAQATKDELTAAGRVYDGTVVVAGGAGFADAVAASPLASRFGWPVLLVRPGAGLSSADRATAVGIGADRGLMVGGTGTVSAAAARDLQTLFGAGGSERVWGVDRYATAAAVARYGVVRGLPSDGVTIASGTAFVEAIAGARVAADHGSVLLLTPSTGLAPAARSALLSWRARTFSVNLVGALSPSAQLAVLDVLK
jgi:putative cell wall-binding protein